MCDASTCAGAESEPVVGAEPTRVLLVWDMHPLHLMSTHPPLRWDVVDPYLGLSFLKEASEFHSHYIIIVNTQHPPALTRPVWKQVGWAQA